jgi:DNA-binding NarL/FixJ family response regulator
MLAGPHVRAALSTSPDRHRHTSTAPLVVIASPARGLRQSWQQSLRGFVVAEVADRAQLRRILSERPPAVLLLDVELPQLDGVDGIAPVRSLQPAAKILVLANNPDDKEGLAALKAGARGYCERAMPPALLKRALEAVQGGEIWVGRKLTSHLLDELSALAEASEPQDLVATEEAVDMKSRLKRLTRRERDIVVELGIGSSNKEIAQKLSVTERTVKAHLTAAFRKLEATGRLQAALLMVEHARSAQL